MKVLITGGAGFIGSNFVRRCISGKYPSLTELIVLDALTYAGNIQNLSEVRNAPNLQFVQGDICDKNVVESLVAESDCIINFAAESHVDRSIIDASSFAETNFIGVLTLLESAKLHKKRLVQVSTDEVYGSIEHGLWKESAPLEPNSPYSASKAAGEMLCRAFNRTHGLDVVTTRSSNNYGPYHHPEKLIPRAIINVLTGKPIEIYGTGTNSRDWLHVDDHCDGIYLALTRGKSGEVYNLGGGNESTNLALINQLLSLMESFNGTYTFITDRKGHDFRYAVDTNKAQMELGFKPRIEFAEGLRDVIDWYISNKKWWNELI